MTPEFDTILVSLNRVLMKGMTYLVDQEIKDTVA
jgi:hypothetical protein